MERVKLRFTEKLNLPMGVFVKGDIILASPEDGPIRDLLKKGTLEFVNPKKKKEKK